MAKPRKISEPHKELRFTRGRQALTFLFLGLVFVLVAIFLWVKATPIVGNAAGDDPAVNSHAWGFLPLLVAIWFFWVSAHCARHAFLILTPLGIEIFPFWRPSKNMQAEYWSDIENARVDDELKVLTIDRKGGGGAVIGLAPIPANRRPLLKSAIEGRMTPAKP